MHPARDTGRLAEALDLAQAAVALGSEVGDHRCETDALNTLATVQQRRAQLDQARGSAEQALALTRDDGIRALEGRVLTTLAGIHLDQGRPDQARERVQRAVAVQRATGQRLGQGRALVILGQALQRTDGREAAEPHWREALALFTQLESPEADQVRGLLRGGHGEPRAAAL